MQKKGIIKCPTKAKLPIFAVAKMMSVGKNLYLADGQTMKVVRPLTGEEVKERCFEFYNIVMEHLPPGAPLYWVECKPCGD